MLATRSAAVGFPAACHCWWCHQGFLELGFHQKGQFLARFCATQRSRAHFSRRTQLTNGKSSVPYPAGSRKTFGNVMRALPESLKKNKPTHWGQAKATERVCGCTNSLAPRARAVPRPGTPDARVLHTRGCCGSRWLSLHHPRS